MALMLQALKHRGPDSTGYALYGRPDKQQGNHALVMRLKVAEKEDMDKGSAMIREIAARIDQVDECLQTHDINIEERAMPTPYALRFVLSGFKDIASLAAHLEEIKGVEILSLGNGLELVKDLGDAMEVSNRYGIGGFQGSHAIGHTRMATESDVDIRSAHPYWAFPYRDISLVHNGQITNYWGLRREMERRGHRFVSNCDSELLAVYVAHYLAKGISLEDTLRQSIEEIDGVFTYFVATKDQLGMAKDTMAAKPLVLYESDDLIAMASEEVAIRAVLPQEIETYDPYDEEVRVWQA